MNRGDIKLAYDRAIAYDVPDVADRLVEMVERLEALEAENARLSALCDKWNSECDECREESKRQDERICALEVHNAVLRDALENIPIGYHAKIMGRDCVCGICESNRRVQEALASTPESSLKEIRRAERERVAQMAESYAYMSENFNALAEEIRQMEDLRE